MERLKKTIAITGASSGIGKSIAIESAKRGWNISCIARNIEALNTLKEYLENDYGVKVLTIEGDVSIEDNCKLFINKTINHFDCLDILINNAGLSMRGLFEETDLTVIKRLMDVNFWGAVYCTKYALPELIKNKGSVVGVSSIAGFKGLPARTGYSASKFALQGFLESLRNENLKTGLHVLIACPGYTESNIRKTALDNAGVAQSETPLDESKLMSSEKVARIILKAIDRKRLYSIMTLQGKLAVFINKWFPKIADKLTYNVIKKEPNSPFS